MFLRAIVLLLATALQLCAAEVPPHIARGHLLAAFCGASPDKKPERVIAIYREIIPVAAPPGSYTTAAFTGGYVGLAGNKDHTGGDTINFSIWGKDAAEVEPADQRHGAIKTRQFTHEGTGWAGRLAYPWRVGTRYQVFVRVRHVNGQTIFSAWFGSAEKHEWLLAGRTQKAGTHYLGHAGGFLEHAGTKDMEIARCTGYGPAWVHDCQQWLPAPRWQPASKTLRTPASSSATASSIWNLVSARNRNREPSTPIRSRLRLPRRHNYRKQSHCFAEVQARYEHSNHQIKLRVLAGCGRQRAPVTQAEEHSGVVHRLLGDAFEQALTLKWVRVSVYATDGLLYFEHDPKQPLSAHQMLALRELEVLHGLRLYDEVKQAVVEAIRPTWASRFPATS